MEYKDINIRKYKQLYKLQEDCFGMEDVDIQVKMISIIYDLTEEEVLNLPLAEYKDKANGLMFLTAAPKPKKGLPTRLKLNGKEYKVIENVREMTAGQYIDYQSYISNNSTDFFSHILSCIIVPKNGKYGDNTEETINDIEEYLSVEEALTISNFFMKKSRSLIKATLFYLEWKMKKQMKMTKDETVKKQMKEAKEKIHMLRHILKNGDGFPQLMI